LSERRENLKPATQRKEGQDFEPLGTPGGSFAFPQLPPMVQRVKESPRLSTGVDYGVAPPGRRTVNTDPLPGSLVTVTSPPIMRASLRMN